MKRAHLLAAFVYLVVTLSVGMLSTPVASAATSANCSKSSNSFLGFPTWYKYLDPEFQPANLGADPPRYQDECTLHFDPTKDVGKVLLAVFEIILRFAGIVAVGVVIYGGFQYILSQGNPDSLKGARSTIINALIGLAIAISATGIVNLIGNSLK